MVAAGRSCYCRAHCPLLTIRRRLDEVDGGDVGSLRFRLLCTVVCLLLGVLGTAAQDAHLRTAQRQLIERGYRLGVPDGFMGRRTAEALRSFQRDQGLEITGRLDLPTITTLSKAPVATPAVPTTPAVREVGPTPVSPAPESTVASPEPVSAPVMPSPSHPGDTASPAARPTLEPSQASRSIPGWVWLLGGGMAVVLVSRLRRFSSKPLPAAPSHLAVLSLPAAMPASAEPSAGQQAPYQPDELQEAVRMAVLDSPPPPLSWRRQPGRGRVSSRVAAYVKRSNAWAMASVSKAKPPDFYISPIMDTLRCAPSAEQSHTPVSDPEPTGTKSFAAWIPAGHDIRIHDLVVCGGLFYFGESLGVDASHEENCLVKPSLSVAQPGKASAAELAYHLHYAYAPPPARRAFLEWLASGRDDPKAPAGLVALYFYGLERRMYRDAHGDEAPILVAEVERLRAIYGGEGWLRQYFDRFLAAASSQNDGTRPELTFDRNSYSGEIAFDVRTYLGGKLARKQPLDAEDALLWVLSVPDTHLRTPAQRCRDELKALWALRFSAAYPDGLGIRAPKKRIQLVYQAASGAFTAKVKGLHEDLPDIAAVSASLKSLRELLENCTAELDPLSRFLGRKPDMRDSASALLLLPQPLRRPQLRSTFGPAIDRLVGDAEIGLLPFHELCDALGLDIGSSAKVGTGIQEQVSAILDELDLGIEPDRRYGARSIERTTPVALFRASGDAPVDPDGGAFQALRHLVEIMVLAAASDGEVSEDEAAAIGTMIAEHGLPPGDTKRLAAYATSLRHDLPRQKTVLNKIRERPALERATIARTAVTTIMADGIATPREVGFLEQLYKALDLPVEDVYGAIHRFDRPSPLPASPADEVNSRADGRKVTIDPERLRRRRAETQEVSRLLSTIFVEDEPATGATPPAAGTSAYSGLDPAHGILLASIANAGGALSRSQFDEAAKRLALLPDGAIETLNDWAFGQFDEPMIDADVDIEIVYHLRERLEEIRARPS